MTSFIAKPLHTLGYDCSIGASIVMAEALCLVYEQIRLESTTEEIAACQAEVEL